MPAGRPRKHDPERTLRIGVKLDRAVVNTLKILGAYLTAHAPPKDGTPATFDMQALLTTAASEYIASHATLVENAVTWYRKGRKPPQT